MNASGFVHPISNIGLVNVCHYVVSFGIIFNSKGLIQPEIQNQTVPVFNAFSQYLHESSNATGAKIQLLRQTKNKVDGDTTVDMKYLNETYEEIINEGLFSYYGNITKYLSMQNFAENTSFTALKKIVFDDLSKNYINNVSCSLKNISSNLEINLTQVAMDNLFAHYIWPVFKRTTEKNIEYGEKRELQIDRRMKRQVSDNDDDDSSNLDMYFAHFSDKDKEELLKAANENLFSDKTEASQFWTFNNDPNIQSQARVGTRGPYEPSFLDDSNFDFLNSFEGSAEDAAVENLRPTLAESNLNYWPFVDIQSSSHPKIRRIDISTENQLSSSENEISSNEDGFVNREKSFSDMIPVQNNRVLGKPGFEIDVDDIPGTSRLSEESQIERFFESKENRRRLGVFDEDEASTFLGSNDQHFDVEIGSNRDILNVNDDFGGNESFIPDRRDNDKDSNDVVPQIVSNVRKGTAQEGELNVRKEVLVQVDYAGRREPVDLIFREMEIGTKSKRMQSIAKAAIIISSNESNNFIFEDSLKILKGYILKLEGSSSLVPSFEKLAIDFCKNNLNVSKEYNKWKIQNHALIDDILFEGTLFFNGTIKKKEKSQINLMLGKKANETLEVILKIYRNSTLLQKSFRLVDFTRLREQLWDRHCSRHDSTRDRLEAAVYRFAIRECDENTKNNITIYRYRYAGHTAGIFNVSIGDNFTFSTIVDFSMDEELEKRKLNVKRENRMRAVKIQINLETNCGIPNIGRALEDKGITGIYLIPPHTALEVIDRKVITFHNESANLIIMRYKRLKEERMVEMIRDLHNLLTNNSKYFDFYY